MPSMTRLVSRGEVASVTVLKRVPSPYDKDHPHGALLRHKGLVIAGHPDLSGDLPTKLEAAYADIWPVSDMLIGVAEAPAI